MAEETPPKGHSRFVWDEDSAEGITVYPSIEAMHAADAARAAKAGATPPPAAEEEPKPTFTPRPLPRNVRRSYRRRK